MPAKKRYFQWPLNVEPTFPKCNFRLLVATGLRLRLLKTFWGAGLHCQRTTPGGLASITFSKPRQVLKTIQFMDRLLYACGVVHGVNRCKRAALVLVKRDITLIAKIVEKQHQAPAYHR